MSKVATPMKKITPFGLFLQMVIEKHRADCPTDPVTDYAISRACLGKWQFVGVTEKAFLKQLAEEEALRREAEGAFLNAAGSGIHGRGFVGPMSKSRKKAKDIEGVEKPMTAYSNFVRVMHIEVQRANPNWVSQRVTKELGRMWKLLPESEQCKYQEMTTDGVGKTEKAFLQNSAEADAVRAEAEMTNFNAVGGRSGGKKKRMKTNGPEGPNKPLSAFVLFCREKTHEFQQANPQMSRLEVRLALGRVWKALPADGRLEFVKRNALERKRYEREMKIYASAAATSATASTCGSKGFDFLFSPDDVDMSSDGD